MTITMKYEEYLELLDRLKKLEEIIGNYYEKLTGEEKKEVYEYLQKYCNWL